MFCPECGNRVEEEEIYCPECHTFLLPYLEDSEDISIGAKETLVKSNPMKEYRFLIILCVMLAILLVAMLGLMLYLITDRADQKNDTDLDSSALLQQESIYNTQDSASEMYEESISETERATITTSPIQREMEETSDTTPGYLAAGYVYNTDSGLRVRKEPNSSSREVLRLDSGSEVIISEISQIGNTLWGKLADGWICLDYVYLTDYLPKKNSAGDSTLYIGNIVNSNGLIVVNSPEWGSRRVKQIDGSKALFINGVSSDTNGSVYVQCDEGWICIFGMLDEIRRINFVSPNPDVEETKIVLEDTAVYANQNGEVCVDSYETSEVVDIYEYSGSMARTDLGWVYIYNLR